MAEWFQPDNPIRTRFGRKDAERRQHVLEFGGVACSRHVEPSDGQPAIESCDEFDRANRLG